MDYVIGSLVTEDDTVSIRICCDGNKVVEIELSLNGAQSLVDRVQASIVALRHLGVRVK